MLHSQKRNRLDASSRFNRLDVSLSLSCVKPVGFIKLLKKRASSLCINSFDNQLASCLLTTCSRLVIIKSKEAMRTHPDIGLMTARQQSCSRLAVVYLNILSRCTWSAINTSKSLFAFLTCITLTNKLY